jgi:riboflavin synthase
MFTGLIESVGTVAEVAAIDAGFSLRIACDMASNLTVGESVAVNGVCLTVVEKGVGRGFLPDHDKTPPDPVFRAEIGPETAKVTSLGGLTSGSRVNLERAMRADGRFGGHMVLGHVDGTGVIQSIRAEADFFWVTISYPAPLAPYLIHRGSIAVDGISLTIAKLEPGAFDVQIVPFTWSHTNLRSTRAGDRVNLECDMVGKYVLRALELMGTKV